jgi:hypothetical protein
MSQEFADRNSVDMAVEAQHGCLSREPKADQNASRFALCVHIEELNREMMRLSLDQQRSSWKEYFNRLSQLTAQ